MGDGPSIISPWPHPSRSDAAKRGVGCQTARCAGFRPAVSRDSAITGKELLFARPPIFSAVRLRENWFLVPPSMMRLCPKPAVVSTTILAASLTRFLAVRADLAVDGAVSAGRGASLRWVEAAGPRPRPQNWTGRRRASAWRLGQRWCFSVRQHILVIGGLVQIVTRFVGVWYRKYIVGTGLISLAETNIPPHLAALT